MGETLTGTSKGGLINRTVNMLIKWDAIFAYWQEQHIRKALSDVYDAGMKDSAEIARLREELAAAQDAEKLLAEIRSQNELIRNQLDADPHARNILREELAAANRRAEKAEGPLQDILDDHAIFCSALKDELHQAISRAEVAQQREREALAMLLRYHIIRTCEFLPERRNEFYESPEVAAMLERAREQEVPRGK